MFPLLHGGRSDEQTKGMDIDTTYMPGSSWTVGYGDFSKRQSTMIISSPLRIIESLGVRHAK